MTQNEFNTLKIGDIIYQELFDITVQDSYKFVLKIIDKNHDKHTYECINIKSGDIITIWHAAAYTKLSDLEKVKIL